MDEKISSVNERLCAIQKGTRVSVIMSAKPVGGSYSGFINSQNIGKLNVVSARTFNDNDWGSITISPSNCTVSYEDSIKAYSVAIANSSCAGKVVQITFD